MSGRQWQRWKGIMKAYPFEEKRLAKWAPPYIVQPKFDGVRCRSIRLANGKYILLSSEENLITSVPHINEALEQLNPMVELDGELYCHGMSFESIYSITSRSVNIHEDYQCISFHIFDIVDEYSPQFKRLSSLQMIGLKHPLLTTQNIVCNNLEDVLRAYDSIINSGFEGIIVRNIDNLYERKRSTLVMKFKPKQEDSYEIVGFEEECDQEGVPRDTLGSLTCKSGNGSTFDVGTGFTDDLRKHFWDARQLLIGATAVVKYQHITSGNKVPRFPVFVKIVHNT
jgi:DNA ligase 1